MTLLSPGVEVQVTDESFYLPAGAGTVPLIFAPTRSNKPNGSQTDTAVGTLDSNAGRVYLISSQLELTNTFGVPFFETDASGNPVHGGELNEYGLQAAYSALGVTSQVYVVRPAVDLAQLAPTSSAPQGTPQSNAQWLDTEDSMYGIGEWNASSRIFVNKTPLVIDDTNSSTALNGEKPAASFGTIGEYAVVVTKDNTNSIWYKNRSNNWVLLGSNEEDNFGANTNTSTFTATSWQTSWPVVTTTPSTDQESPSAILSINGQSVILPEGASVTDIAESINNQMMAFGVGARVVGTSVELYADATASYNGVVGAINLSEDPTIPDTPGILQTLGFGATTSVTFGPVTLAVNSYNRIPNYSTGRNPTGSVFVNTSPQNNGASWVVKTYNAITGSWVSAVAPVFTDTTFAIKMLDAGGGKNIVPGKIIVESNYNQGTGTSNAPIEATFKLYSRVGSGATTISSTPGISTVASAVSFQISETLAGLTGYHNTATVTVDPGPLQNIVTAVSAAGLTNISASYDAVTNTLSISHKLGGDFKLDDVTPNLLSILGFSTSTTNLYLTGDYEPDSFAWRASNWKPLTYTASAGAPRVEPEDGTLWFNPTLDEVDIMYHNGTGWVGYRTAFPNTDRAGPIVSATRPTQQVGGHSGGNFDLVDGDIWIDTSDLDKYGVSVYIWNSELIVPDWVLQDTSDNTSINGWLFADARWSTSGEDTDPAPISMLLNSNYLDPDAPDADLYPQGMRLWNLRRSSNNVKRYARNYINIYDNNGQNARAGNESMENYSTARWVTASPNRDNGAGSFGRFAQRGTVVRALKSMIDTNLAIRDTDTLVFNLMATPGYPETIANMVSLNVDRGQTALIIGDTPFRLQSSATELSDWATNFNGAFDNGETGAVTYDEYLAMFYPSGFTTDNFGNSIVVPPSHMMLRTFITSDQKSYQWFAPAGIRRGGVDNATSVGYIVNGEFRAAALPNNTRDVMYQNAKINPIATLPGSGIVNFGNLTRARTASAMDRINVARLVCYLRRQLDILCRPFLFEPNDSVTRNELKSSVESFLLELVGQRALYDFAVVCDDSNNTPARIDRNELWLDIAVEPVKSVEFIYIPLRLLNTGSIAGG
jgi:hypothetical protein